eukprot:1923035-Rhodomonas_salina.2
MATSHTRSRGAGTQFADRWWFLVRVTARGPGDLSPPICFRRTWTFFFDPFRATCARSTPAPSLLWVLLTHATHNHTRCTHIHTRIPHRRLYSLPQSMPPSLPSPCLPPPSCMHNDAVPLQPAGYRHEPPGYLDEPHRGRGKPVPWGTSNLVAPHPRQYRPRATKAAHAIAHT